MNMSIELLRDGLNMASKARLGPRQLPKISRLLPRACEMLGIEAPEWAFVTVKAGVGVLGQQAIPTAITRFIAWPAAFAQIWGLIQQSKLDEEALDVAAQSLAAHSSGAAGPTVAGPEGAPEGSFCTACGKPLTPAAKFCPECGAKQAA
jgi:hypothetical protein